MSDLEKTLKGGKKLIAFIVGGDPSLDESYEIASQVIQAGVDVLEVGLPFSDPIADGPTIQAAGERSLKGGMNTDRYFELTSRISKEYDTPLVCLTYYNLILQYGLERFASSCAGNGVHGVIVPDLPIEESGEFRKHLKKEGVDFIFLVSQTTTDERLKRICDAASGFIYAVALLGTTGARDDVDPEVDELVKRIKKFTDLPIAVGFGISKPEHVEQVMRYDVEAVIVGSKLVKRVQEHLSVAHLIKELKKPLK